MNLSAIKTRLLYGKYLLTVFLLWCCMSPIRDIAYMSLALVSALLTLLILRNSKSLCDIGLNGSMLCYIYFVARDVVRSSFRLTALIWSKDAKHISTIAWVDYATLLNDTRSAALHANAITMTPGTFVIAIDMHRQRMLVHTLFRSLLSDLPDNKLLKILRD